MNKLILGVLICFVLSTQVWAECDDRYPKSCEVAQPQVEKTYHRAPIDPNGNPRFVKKKTKINWLKPTKMKIEKLVKLPGKTIKDPRSPLRLEHNDIPFQTRWDVQYQPDPVEENHILPGDFFKGAPQPPVPFTVKVNRPKPVYIHRPMPKTAEASFGNLVTALGGATFCVCFLYVAILRPQLLGKPYDRYVNGVECLYDFISHPFQDRTVRANCYAPSHGRRNDEPRQITWDLPVSRRQTDRQGHGNLPEAYRSDRPDHCALEAFARGISSE